MFNDIKSLLKQIDLGEDSVLELKTIEFNGKKIIGPHKNSMADKLSSMANTHTGIILLGVDDKTKKIDGIPKNKLDIVETWLRNICNDKIEPPLNCIIRKKNIILKNDEERIIIYIDIPRSLFVHKSPGGYFRRIGSSKREMKPDMLSRLFQQRSQNRIIRFDEQSVPNSKIDDLNPKLWKRFKTIISSKDNQVFLEKMKLITLDDNNIFTPTISGILMSCETPESFMPSAFIQAVCYRGKERNGN